ncbi:helicase [Cellulophaga phage phi17:2_18]|uniref:Helicase n=2 Tax=Lightbulbvirus Cba172 TaxID=1918525 RepID=R9ZWM8_9CAUD|nr:helicase [Cellulophaga phage phi17:2]AGO47614.1 helicase [Cellulophaga phage phi17:2]ALO80484.1 helicase [Cellulophaga phage phi17:2_18]
MTKNVTMGLTPFPRQAIAISKQVAFLESGTTKKGIFVYPVAFGKSVVIANVAQKFPNKYFINICPNKELTDQNYKKFISYGYEAAVCCASLNRNEIGQVTFATIGTLKKHLNFFKDKEVVILVDECQNHSLKGSSLHTFIQSIKKVFVLGTTATPLRLRSGMGGSELRMMNSYRDCFYSSIEDVVQISEVVADKRWSKLIYEVEDIDESFLKLNTTGTEYTVSSLKVFSEKNNILDKAKIAVEKLLTEGRKSILVYMPFIEDADALGASIEGSVVLHSKVSDRVRFDAIEGFKSGRIKVLINCLILVEGFDYPELSSIVMCRPTNSINQYYQALGRLTRVHKNKKDGKVIDISGNFNKFGKIEDITFENEEWCGGWAAFSGERLLTNYPLNSKIVPTKQSLIEDYERKLRKEDPLDPVFNFGQYKGKSLLSLLKDKTYDFKFKMTVGDRVESYINWIVQEDAKGKFSFYGEAGEKLKRGIYQYLKLPMPNNSKNVISTTIEEKPVTRNSLGFIVPF